MKRRYRTDNPNDTIEKPAHEQVVKYHRTIAQYFMFLQKAEFTITSLRETTPEPQHFRNEEEYKCRLDIPLFLLFSCTK